MADKKFTDSDSADVITAETKAAEPAKMTYPTADFVKASQNLFGYSNALVKTALDMAGKERYAVEEAKQIVTAFANKPVTN